MVSDRPELMLKPNRSPSSTEDYLQQVNVLGNRFVNKGYDKNVIMNHIREVEQVKRENLLQYKDGVTSGIDFFTAIVLDFNYQHKKVERIIKHWAVLIADKQLRSILPEKPRLIYKKAPLVRDRVGRSVNEPPMQGRTFFNRMDSMHVADVGAVMLL